MLFSAKCEYGIRAMLDLALREEDRPVGVRTIADRQGISEGFLEQVFADLRKARLVESVRGSRGGYLLTRSPREITLAQIVEAIDGPMVTASCVPGGGHGGCRQEDLCALQEVWAGVAECVTQALGEITLEGMRERQRRKGHFFGGGAAG